MDINDFFKKYCRNCKNLCDRGLIERETFIRCIDRDIYVNKDDKNVEENKKTIN